MPPPLDQLGLLRARPDWAGARQYFEILAKSRWTAIDQRVADYGRLYERNAAAMVIDVVLSRQRNYLNIVQPTVTTWIAANPGRVSEMPSG
jgi:hypothetical protein